MRSMWPIRSSISGNKGKKVFVGLSGGVDSAVSAALLQKAGYDVTGVFIRIAIEGYPCTAGEDKRDALRVAAHLRIPFVELDLSQDYKEEVFDHMLEEYQKGRTPNPDTLCNKQIKFGKFYDFAKERGADLVATGHYARLKNGELYKGADPEKDQSYFLWMVPEGILKDTFFPIGDKTKSAVRKLAKKFDLPNAERKDSQGLCFLGPVSIDEMLTQELRPRRGDVLNEAGEVVGLHDGAVLYTLGQRHGFELLQKTPETPPHYVIAKNVKANTITVSPNKFPQGVSKTVVTLRDTNWVGGSYSGPCDAQYRYHQKLIPARIVRAGAGAVVELDEAHYAPLGQSLVLFVGERVLGGGVIDTVEYR